MSYEAGLLIAFLLWCFTVVRALVLINSRLNKNLAKVGQRLSWNTLTPVPLHCDELKHSPLRKLATFSLLYGVGLAFVLTSWLYVAYLASMLVYGRYKDSGAPQAVKEYRWKLRNMDLTKDQIIREMMSASGQEASMFDQVKADLDQDMKERNLI